MRLALGLDLPERRIGLSAHDFAQLLGAPEVILTPCRQDRRRADGSRRASSSGSPPSPANAGNGRRARRDLSRLGARTRPAGADHAGAAAGADAAACGAADRPLGHRDRALAARPLYDLCQARSAAAPARCGRCRTRRGGARHHHSCRRRRFHANVSPPAFPPIRSPNCIALGRTAFCRARGFSRGARILVAAFSNASRTGSPAGTPSGATRSPRSLPRSAAKSRSRLPTARSACAASPTASNAIAAGRYVILDYKTGAGAHRKAGAHRACAAAHAGSRHPAPRRLCRTSPPALRSANSPT